jgi:thiol-disulfide isomerase/thioredoxin
MLLSNRFKKDCRRCIPIAVGTLFVVSGVLGALVLRGDRTVARSAAFAGSALANPIGTLLGAHDWLNTPPLQSADLKGKVVLVNFWTYSCINCLRTLPHMRAWAEKYKDSGLIVIGVHTPEFAFEKEVDNVSKAVKSLGVQYPVAIDNDYQIWRAFRNEAWPAFFFIDSDGEIRRQKFGEGDYDQSEKFIQALLTKATGPSVYRGVVSANGKSTEAAPDDADLRSPETYVGYKQATNMASAGPIDQDAPQDYRAPSNLRLNHWALAGKWTISGEYAALKAASGSITYRFHARDLHLVLTCPAGGKSIRFRVKIDGLAPGADHGFDVDADGRGIVQEDRLYQLVRQSGVVKDRTFEIEFLDPGVRAYAFTFG